MQPKNVLVLNFIIFDCTKSSSLTFSTMDGKDGQLEDLEEKVNYYTRDIELESLDEPASLVINQKFTGDVGVVVWDCAIVMSKFFDHRNKVDKGYMRGKTAIELGSGTGVCGLTAAVVGLVYAFKSSVQSLLKVFVCSLLAVKLF